MEVSRLFVLGLAGCGAVSAPASPDAAADAPVDVLTPGSLDVVTQTRFTNGQPPFTPQGNVIVVAVRPDGTMGDMQMTDPTAGTATLTVYPGDSVTAIYPHMGDGGADLTTFYDVKPGDTLTFGLRFSQSLPSTPIGDMTVTWPAVTNAFYDAYTACSGYGFGTGTTGTITEYSSCHHEPMDVVMLAYDNTSGQLTQAGLIPAATFQAGGSLTLAQWRPATQTKSMGLTGLAPEITNVNMLDYEFVNDRVFYPAGSYGGAPSNGQYTSPVYSWPGIGTREWVRTILSRQGPWTPMYIHDSVDATTTPYSLAMPMLPPWLTSNYVASGPAQMAAWFPVGNGPSKGTVARVSWTHESAPYVWTFIVPPGTSAINFPKLPDAIAMNAPHLDDFVSLQFVRVFDIPELAGYDDVRKLPESTIVQLDIAVQLGLLHRVIGNF
jgi:hypothetical protein